MAACGDVLCIAGLNATCPLGLDYRAPQFPSCSLALSWTALMYGRLLSECSCGRGFSPDALVPDSRVAAI
ncbi:hypothetical protein bcgnr5380_63090 [Bacillus cereus]